MSKKAIGILGGMGPLATADLFKKIVLMTKAECDNDHIRIYIDDNSSIPDRTGCILRGGENPLPYMRDSLGKLESCGADCIIMPCNTAHYFLPELKKDAHVPFISILESTADYCKEMFPGKTACILGPAATLEMQLYDKALETKGVPYVTPSEEGKKALMRIIYDVVKAGKPVEECRADFEAVIAEGIKNGADYFILGCTELPIAADELKLPYNFADPTYALARAAILFCGYETV